MPTLKNPRHEKFAQEIAKAKTATAAMAAAGYSDPRNSTRLTKNDEIRCRIEELKERGAARAEVSVASLLRELEEARKLALKLGQASAAVQCTMGKAKICGLIIDRREVGDAGAFDDMTDEELVRNAARLARELGIAGPREVKDDN
jgi:phage terminase small subunit